MNLGQLKQKVRTLINRTDISDALALEFIQQAHVRIERTLRTTAMEKSVYFTATDGAFRLPVDFLEISDIWYNEQEMERVDQATFLKYSGGIGQPRVFVQTGNDIRMRPVPPNDGEIYMRYYAAQPVLQADNDQNIWSVSAVDALTYGACEYACDYFEDERLERFARRFETAMAELMEQSTQEDFAGPMRIQPAYSYQDNW